MKFLSVCSGIEAASVAWTPLGFEAIVFSEIDKFPCAVLAHHYPTVPNLGDMTKFKEWPDYEPDILVGGTPCQSFSVAGLRKGLADPRGNLMLTYLAIADRYQPEWIVWENVPGVLSSGSGRDFGTFLGALGAIGYGWAYRVLDAQWFGVPQRRRRVFVVGYLGDWRRAAAVLFERHSLQGHPPPSREKRETVAPTVIKGAAIGRKPSAGLQWGEYLGDGTCYTLNATEQHGVIAPTIPARTKGGGGLGTDFDCDGGLIHGALTGFGSFTEGKPTLRAQGGDQGGGSEAIAFSSKDHAADAGETAPTLRAMGHAGSHPNAGGQVAVAFSIMPMNSGKDYKARVTDIAQPIMAGGPVSGNQGGDFIKQAMQVRRLTPRECERLQGFPDDYTLIPFTHGKPAADGPRYKALGNSMAVPVMRYIGERIQMIDWLHDTNR